MWIYVYEIISFVVFPFFCVWRNFKWFISIRVYQILKRDTFKPLHWRPILMVKSDDLPLESGDGVQSFFSHEMIWKSADCSKNSFYLR